MLVIGCIWPNYNNQFLSKLHVITTSYTDDSFLLRIPSLRLHIETNRIYGAFYISMFFVHMELDMDKSDTQLGIWNEMVAGYLNSLKTANVNWDIYICIVFVIFQAIFIFCVVFFSRLDSHSRDIKWLHCVIHFELFIKSQKSWDDPDFFCRISIWIPNRFDKHSAPRIITQRKLNIV